MYVDICVYVYVCICTYIYSFPTYTGNPLKEYILLLCSLLLSAQSGASHGHAINVCYTLS